MTYLLAAVLGFIAIIGIIFIIVIIGSNISFSRTNSQTNATTEKKWHESKAILAFLAIGLCLVYGIIRLDLYKGDNAWSTLGLVILGTATLIAMIKSWEMPGKVGTWMIFLITCAFVIFDFFNLLLPKTGLIDSPVSSWKGFIQMFEGDYTVWAFILLAAIILISTVWFKPLAIIGTIFLVAMLTNFTSVDTRLKKVHASVKKNTEIIGLSLPLSAHPKLYNFKMGDSLKSTKENTPKKLRCKIDGCFVQVNGFYRIQTTNPKKIWHVGPAGNCEVDKMLSKRVRDQLPAYVGNRPCFGALMISTDGQNYKAITANSQELTEDEVSRQIGKLYGASIYIKLYIGKGTFALSGDGIDVMTFTPIAPS